MKILNIVVFFRCEFTFYKDRFVVKQLAFWYTKKDKIKFSLEINMKMIFSAFCPYYLKYNYKYRTCINVI